MPRQHIELRVPGKWRAGPAKDLQLKPSSPTPVPQLRSFVSLCLKNVGGGKGSRVKEIRSQDLRNLVLFIADLYR